MRERIDVALSRLNIIIKWTAFLLCELVRICATEFNEHIAPMPILNFMNNNITPLNRFFHLGLTFVFTLALHAGLYAQGLENIIVETYYISDANDANADADGGVLPVGSVTYRVFADMLPGYKFQAAYGVPGHELRIETSTLFFNNEDRGATTPTYSKTQARNNTVMLDSWFSVGAACTGQVGVLKTDDDTVATVINSYSPPVLQNNDPLAGIPLTERDGMIPGTPEAVTFVGLDPSMFDAQNDGTNGPSFVTDNGSWAALNGASGPTADNRVLIGQFTTDGSFSFELNVQVGTPSGGVENYVARNPVGTEVLFPSCIYPGGASGIAGSEQAWMPMVAYPNPASDAVSVTFKPAVTGSGYFLSLYDASGRLVRSIVGGNSSQVCKETVSLANLSPGLYSLVATAGGSKAVTKLVIE